MSKTLTIDLTNYKQNVSDRVEPGRYKVRIDDYDSTKSSSGNPMLVLYLKVVDGDHAGAVIIDRLAQTEKALFRTVNLLTALGMPTPKKRLNLNLQNLLNRTLWANIEDSEPYMNRINSQIRGYERYVKESSDETDGLDDIEADAAIEADADTGEVVDEVTDADAGVDPASTDDSMVDLDEVEL